MSKEYIVTISEGEKTEKQIIENLQRNFFSNERINKELIILSFKTHIYALWKVLNEDDFETNIIEVLIERDPSIKDALKNIDKKLISEIYLFFDYDGQAYKISEVDRIISKMIEVFDNETENGKIYVSYPMVEAVKDLKKKDSCSRRCAVPAKVNIDYKKLVGNESDFCDLTALTSDDWFSISKYSLKKANCIVSSAFVIPAYNAYKENINQAKIFENQVTRFINVNQSIAVLGGFPFFLMDYFGETLYEAIKNKGDDNVIESCCQKQ